MTRAAARYSLYGLGVESTVPLSCLTASPGIAVDVRLNAGTTAQFQDARRRMGAGDAEWFQCGEVSADTFYLRWSGLFEFLVDRRTGTILYRRLRCASQEAFNSYLLGQVLSFPLLALGYEPLHATAVEIDGKAVAFLGDCGHGKSTLGAAFVARGYPVLTDDLLTLECRNGRWVAHPGPNRIKLYPDSAAKFLPRTVRGMPLNGQTTKLVLAVHSDAPRPPVPVDALYVLPRPGGPTPRSSSVTVTPLPPQKAFLMLVRSSFNLIQVDRTRLANQFRTFTRLARDVPVMRLSYRRRLSSLDAVCTAIVRRTMTGGRRRRAHDGR